RPSALTTSPRTRAARGPLKLCTTTAFLASASSAPTPSASKPTSATSAPLLVTKAIDFEVTGTFPGRRVYLRLRPIVAAAAGHAAELKGEVARVAGVSERFLVRDELLPHQIGQRLIERLHAIGVLAL